MKTSLPLKILKTPLGMEANAILRSCVHCGFCTATCPTFQLLGDELDSPRGRIYLIKELLEEKTQTTTKTQNHLDRCLTCRSCETTCPSGVKYSRLVDIGREIVEKKVERKLLDKLFRNFLNFVLPNRKIFLLLISLGNFFRPLVPKSLKQKIPQISIKKYTWPNNNHKRKMLILDGCVQPILSPSINFHAARILDKLGISCIRTNSESCCGAVSQHLNKHESALLRIKNNIDNWLPLMEKGYEGIVITASGCGSMIKDYHEILKHDKEYALKAEKISKFTLDISEVIFNEKERVKFILKNDKINKSPKKIAYHSPCSLQHGQKVLGKAEEILKILGYNLTNVENEYLCCGSAGTYSILQPKLSKKLLSKKVRNLTLENPDEIVTANIGCLHHIKSGTTKPISHWVELISKNLN